MRIAIDIRSLEDSGHGGVSEYLNNLLPELFKKAPEHQFCLFTNSYRSEKDYSPLLKSPNVSVYKFNIPNKLLTFSCRYFKRPFIDELVGGADVFFSPHFLPAPVSASCRKIITFHDISFERFPEYFDSRRRIWHKYISPQKQAASADKIIAVSESTKSDLVNIYGVSPDNIDVIHSGICKSITTPTPLKWRDIKNKYDLPDNYILSLSTIEPRKNIVGLIRAFNLIKKENMFDDLSLVISGSKGWAYDDVFKEAQISPYKNQIIFTGSVEEEEKHILYSNASVFAYPSLYEGFGFPPLEAMRTGTPVVASMTTSLPEVTKGASVLINPFYPKDIAEGLRSVLKDERLREYLSGKGKEVAALYEWEKAATETLETLSKRS
ncbi:MAG: glycosyltransferase family 1 protein [Candidatus Spechtbacterales bacterium]